MRVYVLGDEVERVRRLEERFLFHAWKNHRLVPMELLRHFCGVGVSLSLALPMARFYTWSVFFHMATTERKEREGQGIVAQGQSPQRSDPR